MQREAKGISPTSDNDEELNTEQRPLLAANNKSALQQDRSTAEAHPLPDDSTPLLDSASLRRDYRTVSPMFGINSEQENLRPVSPRVAINSDLERSLHTSQPTIWEDEEDENQLTASLPSSLVLRPSEAVTGQGWRERGVFPLTDTGDDDETFQAKLLAVRKEARHRRKMRKTISGALDITEDVSVALLGNPNLAEACHHSPAASRSDTPQPNVSQPSAQGVCTYVELCVGHYLL